MKIGLILHQQMMQLRWHFLACLGLLMALPIEEAIINLKDGEGFYATGLSLGIPVMAGALLAGLIACANVQADLDDQRYVFWRSKPVGVKTFITLKYFVGLLMAFVLIATPVVFALISCSMVQGEKIERGFVAFIVNFQLISLLTYSLCFFCNTLVRKTARAWLIGMATACFLLLVPFILPFRFKDISGDFLLIASTVYISITIGASLIAFILSLFAVSHDWHLKTNLKGLLWTGAALIFLFMLLFTRQVANIKVLDEIETETVSINNFNNRIVCGGRYIDVQDGQIQTSEMHFSKEVFNKLLAAKPLYDIEEGLRNERFPHWEYIYHETGDETYAFRLIAYYDNENIAKHSERRYKKVYLQSYRYEGGYHIPVSVIDLSEFITDDYAFHMVMRKVNDKLAVFIKDSYAVVQFSNTGVLQLIDKKVNGLRGNPRYYSTSVPEEFKINIIPLSDIDKLDQIKLSIDMSCQYYHLYGLRNKQFHSSSLVEEYDGIVNFYLLSERGIARYNVVKSDEEYIYCKIRDKRNFTFLEQMFGQVRGYDPYFVKNGKLYAHSNHKLMVFDLASDHIRKLGHFERISDNFDIHDIGVLNDGDILMSVSKGLLINSDSSRSTEYTLYLLKNPE